MSWHLLEKILDEVSKQSTIFGKIWVSLLFIFRVLAVTRMGDTVYADEQAAFRCNIKQPGCENVCFNDFSPISHVRFWGFQIIIVATPSMMFMVYAAHKVSQVSQNCKLVGRQIEFARPKGQACKSKALNFLNKKRRKKPDVLSTKFGQVQNRTKETRTCNQNKHNLVTNWNRISSKPTPITEITNFSDILHNSSRIREKSGKDSPPAYREKNEALLFEELPIASIASTSLHVDEVIHSKSGSPWSIPHQLRLSNELPSNTQRRHSDGDALQQEGNHLPNHERCLSADVNPLKSYSSSLIGKSPPQYSNMHICYENDFSEPTYPLESLQNYQLCAKNFPRQQMRILPRFSSSSKMRANTPKTASPLTIQNRDIWKFTPSNQKLSLSPLTKRACDQSTPSGKTMVTKKAAAVRNLPGSDVNAYQSGKSSSSITYNSTGYIRFAKRVEFIQGRIATAYFVQSSTRLLLENLFLLLQYYLFSFEVPELYRCNKWPCPNTVDCYISRPNEKSIMLYFMFVVTIMCIFLTVMELIVLTKRHFLIIYENKRNADLATVSSGECNEEPKKQQRFGKCDFIRNPHLLEGYANIIKRRSEENYEESDASSSESTATESSKTETDSEEIENDFDIEDLSSMLDNDAAEDADAADYNEQDAVDAGYV